MMLDEILVFHDCRFENEVRSVLRIPQRPIKTSEALKVTMLDCCFDSDELFDPEDYQTLQLFTNLKLLWIECREDSLPTIGRLVNLEELHINCIGWNQTFDFQHLCDIYHLWVLPKHYALPFGLHPRRDPSCPAIKRAYNFNLEECQNWINSEEHQRLVQATEMDE